VRGGEGGEPFNARIAAIRRGVRRDEAGAGRVFGDAPISPSGPGFKLVAVFRVISSDPGGSLMLSARPLRLLCVISLVLLGCLESEPQEPITTDDDDATADDDDTTAGDDDSAQDAVGIASTYPENGATDVYHRNPLVVEFDSVVEGVALELVEEDSGDDVDGTLAVVDALPPQGGSKRTVVTFDPHGDDPEQHMTLETSYLATITWSGGSHAWAFQTSGVGVAVEDLEADVVGGDYEWDLSTARVVHPYYRDALGTFGAFGGTHNPVFRFTDIDADGSTAVAFAGAAELDGGVHVQNLCEATAPPADERTGTWSNPYFGFGTFTGPYGWLFGLPLGDVLVRGGTLQGGFTDGGETFTGGIFDAYLDIAGLCSLIVPDCDEHWEMVCDRLTDFGLYCVECPDDGEPFCVHFLAFDIQGSRVDVTGTDPGTGETYTTLTDVDQEQVSEWYSEDVCP